MVSDCVLDAHALLWFLEGNAKLGDDARLLLLDANNRFIIPAIAFAEVCRITEKRKTKIPSVLDLFAAIDGDSRIRVDPIDRDLVQRSSNLAAISEMHDRLIVAAAIWLRERSPSSFLLSADANIRKSGLVAIRW